MREICNDIMERHPCFGGKRGVYGRIHLPVAPYCNIQCGYCERKFGCNDISRPGVTDRVMDAEEAIAFIRENDTPNNNLQVLGIAGPGEPLCNANTYKTLQLIQENYPDKISCLSTNGLLLPEKLAMLEELGVDSITITMNTLREETAKKIYQLWENDYISKLLENQQKGAELVGKSNILLKINMVYIPTVNDKEVREMAIFAQKVKANIMNVMPLIPGCQFAHLSRPTSFDIESAQIIAGAFVKQLLGCSQCRADAVGIPGCGRQIL